MEDLKMKAPKTKEMVATICKALKAGKALMSQTARMKTLRSAAANPSGAKTTMAVTLSVYDILNFDKFIVTKDAIQAIEEVYA